MSKRRSSETQGEFHFARRLDLYLDICADQDVNRIGLHTAAVLLLHHTNSKTGQCNPSQELIAQGMNRSERRSQMELPC
jgi:hypothetical protein